MPTERPSKVFVVHGHNLKIRDSVTQYLRQLGTTPIVLQDEANQGDTVIEKFERHSEDIAYAVVLMTIDDFGASDESMANAINAAAANFGANFVSVLGTGEIKSTGRKILEQLDPVKAQFVYDLFQGLSARPRQNVILELGYFVGRLGRKRVCIIVEETFNERIEREGNNMLSKLPFFNRRHNKDREALSALPALGQWDLPSDMTGIVFMKYADDWKSRLRSELKAAGAI